MNLPCRIHFGFLQINKYNTLSVCWYTTVPLIITWIIIINRMACLTSHDCKGWLILLVKEHQFTMHHGIHRVNYIGYCYPHLKLGQPPKIVHYIGNRRQRRRQLDTGHECEPVIQTTKHWQQEQVEDSGCIISPTVPLFQTPLLCCVGKEQTKTWLCTTNVTARYVVQKYEGLSHLVKAYIDYVLISQTLMGLFYDFYEVTHVLRGFPSQNIW